MRSSIGVFHEGEINGKPLHIFTYLSQTSNPSSSPSSSGEAANDSGGNNDLFPPQPLLFFCPSFRRKVEKLKLKELGYSSDDDVLPFNTPPYFPHISNDVDQNVQSLLDSDDHDDDYDRICKLPLLPLFWCNNEKPNPVDHYLNCQSCRNPKIGTDYYLCPTCREIFHKECVEAPLEIKHPSYPFLSFRLYTPPLSDYHYWSCTSCRKTVYQMVYHCPTYNFSMHQVCLMKPISILIDHLKRHPHSLTFFPKQNSLLCNVCGVIKESTPTYVCARCVFVVHQDCIYFPYVIRISRHQHRISFTYSLPTAGRLSCGVCRQKVDNDCGAYFCNKCDGYFAHSRCALRRDLWDGKELEGVAEEPEIVVEPFEKIADGIILHFSHAHHLKLEISIVYDDNKLCQACTLPIYEGMYYSCMDQCDFILHETCANALLKKHHPLHAHPLTLRVVTNRYTWNEGRHFTCGACGRRSCGFVYEDPTNDFRLDLRCALVSEPFKYEGHEHPLFLALTPEEEGSARCQICHFADDIYDGRRKLNCIECDYIICFKCATLPYKAMYKHDKHLLTFRARKEGSDESGWCEICEREMVYSRQKGYYSCDDYCCTTLHVNCLLGKDPYMKPGQTIMLFQEKVHILRNNTMSRPFCHLHDETRCKYRLVFEKENVTFCSYDCHYKFSVFFSKKKSNPLNLLC